jgi:predicted DNA-binding transcriptional regulator AlpA
MKKSKSAKQFLLELTRVPIVQVACEKAGLSRNTVYRWRKEDKEFEKKMDQALADGVALVNDMSESQLLTLIKEKNFPAVRFWLNKRHPAYKDKIEVTRAGTIEELTPERL